MHRPCSAAQHPPCCVETAALLLTSEGPGTHQRHIGRNRHAVPLHMCTCTRASMGASTGDLYTLSLPTSRSNLLAVQGCELVHCDKPALLSYYHWLAGVLGSNVVLETVVLIIIKLPDQAIASTPSAPPGRKKEGAPLHYVCNYYAHPKLSQDTQQCS
jgi:hypothetical protein